MANRSPAAISAQGFMGAPCPAGPPAGCSCFPHAIGWRGSGPAPPAIDLALAGICIRAALAPGGRPFRRVPTFADPPPLTERQWGVWAGATVFACFVDAYHRSGSIDRPTMTPPINRRASWGNKTAIDRILAYACNGATVVVIRRTKLPPALALRCRCRPPAL